MLFYYFLFKFYALCILKNKGYDENFSLNFIVVYDILLTNIDILFIIRSTPTRKFDKNKENINIFKGCLL